MDNLKVFDMRFDIGSITVVGPLATNALLSVLKSSHSTNVGKAFKSFHGLRPDELGAYSIYSFQIKDPRRSFPPKLITEPASKDNQYLLDCTTKPDASSLFCHSSTRACNENKPSSVGIKVTDCPDIPVLVYQSKLGLVVLTPWAYVTDIWYNLNHLPLVRFGGLQELAQIHYERSLPFFPTDYQGTEAGDKAAKEDRNKREKWYLRRPPAKRLSYKKSINGKPEIGDPFTCDFYYLINTPADQTQSDVSHVTVSVVENPSLNDTTMDDTYLSAPLYTSTPLIILPSTQTPGSVPKQSASQDPPIIVDTSMQENSNPLKPVLFTSSQLKTLTTEDQECGIMHVRIRMVQRGSPKACARIYHCEGKQPGHLIGFLTTGNYSLAEGRATGIASLRAKYIREHVGDRKKQCFVRDSGSGHFRLASWELIHT
ncbi:Putative uncharacterized protein [Taphrina deformans PYCC 5710]|uniref:Uncharacterized protein n=1 Tax=Taphrina deformans (strain PYCC 5710 / ATCC 11124 / CBS 356.35 / IMI 108563 / JCM 9778 / NBRC 8474) TaxID=1097556 RepID=R4X814_TAPDE|nr:Putative uncharacterized protein [Taphrina deformans PYCC 5710]|eukprot:CCG81392.1 Putative uncharacterized protein [Taphrina deformans PYCC 5710]